MDHVKIIGYFKEHKEEWNKSKEELFYFVAYENEYNYTETDIQEGRKWVEGYNVIDGHFQLSDRDYLNACQKITREEYLQATQNYATPEIYL